MSDKQNRFPPGWDAERVRRVIADYEQQGEEEAVAEDEATFGDSTQTIVRRQRADRRQG